jgi:thiosulfate/3-mercaptopyruvate sulfurtransferase
MAQGMALGLLWMPLWQLQDQASPLRWPLPKMNVVRVPEVWIEARALAGALGTDGGGVAVDVRDEASYRAGHVRRAVHLAGLAAVAGAAPAELRRDLGALGISGNETVVLYDGGGDPADGTARLFWRLAAAGVSRLRVLRGGFAAWQAAGLAAESGAPPAMPAAFTVAERTDVEVSAGWLREHCGDEGVQVLDVRDGSGWESYEMPARFAAGHVARSLPFAAEWLMDGGGSWLSPAEMRRRLGRFGPREKDPVDPAAVFVLYGDDPDDARPWRAGLMLASAGLRVRLFPGGWREWQARGEPVVEVISAAGVRQLLVAGGADLAADGPRPGVVLLDLREARDYALGHLPGAVNLVPDARPLAAVIGDNWPGADRARVPCILYCYGAGCVRSWRAASAAVAAGFHTVLWFRDGFPGWVKAGYPLLGGASRTGAANRLFRNAGIGAWTRDEGSAAKGHGRTAGTTSMCRRTSVTRTWRPSKVSVSPGLTAPLRLLSLQPEEVRTLPESG